MPPRRSVRPVEVTDPGQVRDPTFGRVAQVLVVPVPPELAGAPPTLPLRFAEVGRRAPGALSRVVPAREGRVAVAAAYMDLEVLPGGWPTVDVLVLHEFPVARAGVPLSTARTGEEGTLGWLLRLLAGLHVRLAVVAATPDRLPGLRRLAVAAALRGAGAFVVVDTAHAAATARTLARQVLGDYPLDEVAARLPGGATLVTGAGRTALLRFGVAAADEAAVSARQLKDAREYAAEESFRLAARWRDEVSEFQAKSRPFGARARVLGLRVAEVRQAPARHAQRRRGVSHRYLNARLATTELDTLSKSTPLRLGERVVLSLGVGAFDRSAAALRAERLLDETLWGAGESGAWFDLAVTGIDFTVVGSPVQEVWLTRGGTVDPRSFVVVPTVPGVSMLRYCLYRGNDLVQSFRLAALTVEEGAKPTAAAREALVDVLGKEAGSRAWGARFEYSVGPAGPKSPARPRDLSLVVNDVGGRRVVTVKGADLFVPEVNNGSLPGAVKRVRAALNDVAGAPRYAFVPGADPAVYDLALQRLAQAGWELFDAVVPVDATTRVAELLAEGDRAIQVAHVALDSVVPWAVMYDRRFDDRATLPDGKAAAKGTCHAPVATPEGLTTTRCGTLPDCLLHDQAYTESTVACPLRFWGFRHRIEVPPQQVEEEDQPRPRLVDEISAATPPRWWIGANPTIRGARDHVTDLKKLAAEFDVVAVDAGTRAGVIAALQASDLDLVYLYCHARGTDGDDPPAELLFGDLNGPDFEAIRASDLVRVWWDHHPLVVLNGCGTVGYSPAAVSPFIRKMVGLGAAGIVATETKVYTQLATDVGQRLMHEFLTGTHAGEAMRRTRIGLLAERNPLGLTYTLYASLDLHLVR